MNQTNFIKISMLKRIIILLGIVIFILSLTLYAVFLPGYRRIFLFESLDRKGLYAEYRYQPRKTVQGEIAFFVDELLLGPAANRYRPLFPRGTAALQCFIGAKSVLYINLNEQALLERGNSSETKAACRLLEKNIKKNYTTVDTVVLFMMGHEIYKKIVENSSNL